MLSALIRRAAAIDARLLAAPAAVRWTAIAATVLVVVGTALVNVPRAYVDYSSHAWLRHVPQPAQFGTDTIADGYEARVVRHDWRDMYTKQGVAETPLEAATWSREASAPYPPAVLLAEAAAAAAGDAIGVGLYGVIALLAVIFVGGSLIFFLRTRWYLFPLLYLNFSYFGARFFYVQDGSYLVMLVTLLAAIWLAHRRVALAHVVMALATTMKLSPLAYLHNITAMRRWTRWAYGAILGAGLLLPAFVWTNYLYIFRFEGSLKGHWYDGVAALALVLPFTIVLWYVERRRGFDVDDRIGWDLIPAALWLALKMNVARHLLIVLLVPDRRGLRNVAAAAGLAVPALLPGVPVNAGLPVATAVLILALACELQIVGWPRVRADFASPLRTIREILSPGGAGGRAGART